ncbi:MAG: alpha/beta hydrolase family protein [Candidatus Sumerlaeia bacterium]
MNFSRCPILVFRLLPLLLLFLVGCHNSKLAYTPADETTFREKALLVKLEYEARGKKQSAWYFPPEKGTEARPDPLVLVYPGINTRTLDWLWLATDCPRKEAGFLFIEYPGRGYSEGMMRPSKLGDNTSGALDQLAEESGYSREALTDGVRLIGHSFGCGVALQAAQQLEPRSIVLAAPFNTLRRAIWQTHGPLAWITPDNMDNRKYMRRLLKRLGPDVLQVAIFHGEQDPLLPFRMGQELARVNPDRLLFYPISDGDHSNILRQCQMEFYRLIFLDPNLPHTAELVTKQESE